jgi:hypothetical protein
MPAPRTELARTARGLALAVGLLLLPVAPGCFGPGLEPPSSRASSDPGSGNVGGPEGPVAGRPSDDSGGFGNPGGSGGVSGAAPEPSGPGASDAGTMTPELDEDAGTELLEPPTDGG